MARLNSLRTGSPRSVGKRRAHKAFTIDGVKYLARSAADARRQAGKRYGVITKVEPGSAFQAPPVPGAGGGGGPKIPAAGGGGGGGTPKTIPPLGATGTASGWTGTPAAEPPMSPGQVGVWYEITADVNFTAWPLVLAAPVTLTIPMSDKSNLSIILPAKSYPDGGATDGGSKTAVNGLGWQILYDYLDPTPKAGFGSIVGTMVGDDKGKLFLRVDVLAGATVYPIAK